MPSNIKTIKKAIPNIVLAAFKMRIDEDREETQPTVAAMKSTQAQIDEVNALIASECETLFVEPTASREIYKLLCRKRDVLETFRSVQCRGTLSITSQVVSEKIRDQLAKSLNQVSSDPKLCRCWYQGWGNDIVGTLFTCRHCGSKAELVGGRWISGKWATIPPPAATPVLPTPVASDPAPPPEHPATHRPDPSQ